MANKKAEGNLPTARTMPGMGNKKYIGKGSSTGARAPAASGVAVASANKAAKAKKNGALPQAPNVSVASEGIYASHALLLLSQESSAQRQASIEAASAAAAAAQIALEGAGPYQHYQMPQRTSLAVPMGHPSSRDEEHMGYIDKPTLYDVLCGKGGEVNNHEGNKRYLKLVEVNKENYRKVCKGSKKLLSQLVVQWVNNGGHIDSTNTADWKIPPHQQKALHRRPHVGRFIKKSTINDLWYEIDNHSAWSKVTQAFREGGDNCWPPPSKGTGVDSDEFDEGADSAEEDAEAVTPGQDGDGTNKDKTKRKKQAEQVQDCDLIIPAELNEVCNEAVRARLAPHPLFTHAFSFSPRRRTGI
jgi:hypothetical protein